MTHTTKLAVTAALLCALAVACSRGGDAAATADAGAIGQATENVAPSDDATAGTEAVELLESYGRAEWPAIYERMHPAQQAVVTEDQYVRCGHDATLASSLAVVDSIEVLAAEHGEAEVAGTDEVVPAVQVSLGLDDSPTPAEVTMVYVEGSWRWTAGDVDVREMLSC